MSKQTFSLAAIANVAGKKYGAIYHRAKVLGINNRLGRYTAEQAYDLVYYKRPSRKETLEQETARLLKAIAK